MKNYKQYLIPVCLIIYSSTVIILIVNILIDKWISGRASRFTIIAQYKWPHSSDCLNFKIMLIEI